MILVRKLKQIVPYTADENRRDERTERVATETEETANGHKKRQDQTNRRPNRNRKKGRMT